ncbi:retrotransposon protein [Cucumis melo var. makuwa]|uniref:Retrotransposon protein n=1 Tax=Cucumis melo var. makuwa TaxID=1194695 RepID=A0A5A7SWD7_CUCMM|nr:retrotransposon protein [Cucumis melo var. makuwa]TYK30908.1 retrotransposon protein [Cucumis melo var. makuwa]
MAAHAETFADIDLNVPADNDSVPTEDGIDMEFPAMCSPRMNMSPKDMMGSRSSRSSDGRTGSSGLKRKCSSLRHMTWFRNVIELMEAIPNLTMAEKSMCVMIVNEKMSLMRSFIKMFDSRKAFYCRVLLSGDP